MAKIKTGNQKAGRDINLAGRDINYHNYPLEEKRLLLRPKGPDNAVLETSEKYWNFITKRKSNLLFYFILPFILSALAGQDYFFTKIFSSIYISSTGIAVFVLFSSVIFMKINNSCPKCGKGFAVKEVGRELLNYKVIKDTRVTNISVNKECRKCGHKIIETEIIEDLINNHSSL